MQPQSSLQLNIITIIGSTGLIIIGIILVLSLNTPIYGYTLIGATLCAVITYIIYKKYQINKYRQATIQAVAAYDREIFGMHSAPHCIQLERI